MPCLLCPLLASFVSTNDEVNEGGGGGRGGEGRRRQVSLISSNSHRNGAGNLHRGVFNPPALLYRNGTRGLLGDCARFVCGSVLCFDW